MTEPCPCGVAVALEPAIDSELWVLASHLDPDTEEACELSGRPVEDARAVAYYRLRNARFARLCEAPDPKRTAALD